MSCKEEFLSRRDQTFRKAALIKFHAQTDSAYSIVFFKRVFRFQVFAFERNVIINEKSERIGRLCR